MAIFHENIGINGKLLGGTKERTTALYGRIRPEDVNEVGCIGYRIGKYQKYDDGTIVATTFRRVAMDLIALAAPVGPQWALLGVELLQAGLGMNTKKATGWARKDYRFPVTDVNDNAVEIPCAVDWPIESNTWAPKKYS